MAKRWALAVASVATVVVAAAVACDDGDGDGDADVDLPACPADPPASGAACDPVGQHCTWQRCAAEEPTVFAAWCMNAGWSVSTQDCLSLACESETCLPGELCLVRSGGALLTECVANPCGEAAVEASCACDLCAGQPCAVEELTITCNTCSSGQCP